MQLEQQVLLMVLFIAVSIVNVSLKYAVTGNSVRLNVLNETIVDVGNSIDLRHFTREQRNIPSVFETFF